MNKTSRSTLRMFPLEPGYRPFDPSKFCLQSALDSRRAPVPVRYLGNVLPSYAEVGGDAAVNPGGEFLPVNETVHLSFSKRDKGSRGNVPPRSEDYRVWNKLVKKKLQKVLLPDVSSPPGARMRILRKSRGLTQVDLAELLGVAQSQVTKWEKHGSPMPSGIMVKLSELVPDGPERQWWRDQAARRAGFAEDIEGKPSIGFPLSSVTSTRIIPLVTNPLKVGVLGQMDIAEIKENLQLPSHWFSDGGVIRAVEINIPLSPLIAGEHIALIDISRRDPDRLVGCVVATRTVTGIEVRLLEKDRETYLLLPLYEGAGRARVLKQDGEDSIVGQVLKWIADAPGSHSSEKGLRLN